jgi:hypothetical protein
MDEDADRPGQLERKKSRKGLPMSYRVRLKMKWTVNFASEGMPFSQEKDFYRYARQHLAVGFSNYDADLRFFEAEGQNLHFPLKQFDIEWDVTLDQVPGAWHQPEDHARLARSVLHERLLAFSSKIEIEVLRHPTENDPDGATTLVPWDDGFPRRDFDAFKARMAAEDAAAA